MCNCNQTTIKSSPCGCEPCEDTNPGCSCPVKDLSTDCILYTGLPLACSGIDTNTVMTEVIQDLDQFICDKFEEVLNYFTLINVGGGAEVYKGITGIGEKELRTVVSEDTSLLDIVQNSNTIGIKAGTPSLGLNSGTDVLSLIMTTISGAVTLSTVDLSEYNYDTFVQNVSFSNTTDVLTITRNNSEPNITVDLGHLHNHLESAAYVSNSSTVVFTLTDSSTVTLDLAALLADIAGSQVQSDYLEANTVSKAHILNRNPSKTVTGNYTVVVADNNYIIEIDNGGNDVTINLAGSLGTSNFFVGFVQKGTGEVTFTGQDIIPELLTNIIFGQGHICALEIINSTKYLHGTLKFA